jgi:glycosyltransferase involved in cell wall biosynthesis
MNLGNLAPLLRVGSTRSLVLTYDLHALQLPQHYRHGWARTYWRLAAAAYRRATWRTTLSRTIADELERTLGGRVARVIPPGIDDAFRPVGSDAIAPLHERLGIKGPYLAVVGWAQPAKRAQLAVEAHRLLVKHSEHQLVIVGANRGDFAPVALGSLYGSIVFGGRLSDVDLASLYSGASGLLFPSEYEGFGLPPVEALACGAPVAASRIPVLEEVLDGLPGVQLVTRALPEDWAAAAEALLRDDDDRSARSGAALARYPWEGRGRELLDVVGA